MTAIVLVDPTASSTSDVDVELLLEQVDQEFCPPLSCRSDTRSTIAASGAGRGLSAYLEAMRQESWLLAVERGRVVGLLSFVLRRDDPVLPQCFPSLYATTVAVVPDRRRAGTATQLYRALADHAGRCDVPYLTTRTWTTNDSHARLLAELGFRVVATRPDERAPGIGSVHFACRVG